MDHGHGTECGCHGHAGQQDDPHSAGGCCHPKGYGRHFFTSEEKIKHLEKYLEHLKAEAAGVEEELARLKG